MSVTVNQNLEINKLRGGGGTRKAERGRKPGLLCHTVSQAVHAEKKKKVLKEIKCYSSEHTDEKRDSLTADMEKALVVWMGAQTNHHIPLAKASFRARPKRSSIL